ncbi:MAG TPA: TetR/AcrR family transcriptional regulator, partial [Polyangiales bacterium]|nr:TetR/AcrR family transcriptional regulator [Polyangiales bacterium]
MAHISSAPRPSRSRDARVERTRNALREALLRLLEQKSFEQITIRDLSATAGAGYATYFRHYPDKAALLNDLASLSISELLERTFPILYAIDTLAACVALCRYVDERRQLWSTLLTGGAAGTVREEFLRQARVLAASQPKKRQPGDLPGSWLPDDLAVVFGVSGVVEILAWWLQHRRAFTLEQVAGILDRLVIAPILQTEPP